MTTTHLLKVMDVEEGFWQTAAAKLTLIELAYRADRKGIVRRSQSEMATANAMSRATLIRWLQAFEGYGLLERIGHGRYRLNISLLDELEDLLIPDSPQPKGAKAELERLQAIRQADQGIGYRRDGWPVLVPLPGVVAQDNEPSAESISSE